MDWILIILTIICWLVVWNIIKSIFFSNAIVSFKTYYGTMFGCFVVGCAIAGSISDWVTSWFNFFILM